jgi:hypothetical protein
MSRAEADRRYNQSAKGRARHARYNQSAKGAERVERYEATHKAQERRDRYEYRIGDGPCGGNRNRARRERELGDLTARVRSLR